MTIPCLSCDCQVSKWREGKLEALRVESERAAREREKAEAQERMERESIAALRKKQHAKVSKSSLHPFYSSLEDATTLKQTPFCCF